ncbi:MAG TPA: GntR family transcriptional regulator [Spirochaetia bacterium]|nr:GntR family transcriptional regulator [Spirochaetia bacterium]
MTKYQQVQEWITDAIRTGRFRAGDLLPSENELCTILEVGRNSVRTALNNLSHDGIVETRKGIGTFCLPPRRSKTMTIGFVCLYSQEYIFPRVVQGSNQVLSRADYHLVLSESRRDTTTERDVLQKLWKRDVDGIILQPAYNGSDAMNVDLLRDIELSGVPVILIDNFYPNESFNAVVMNDRAGGRLAASHLWRNGHRNIGIVYHRTYYPKILRMQGARDYMRETGHAVRDNWIIGFDRMGNLEEVKRRLRDAFENESRHGRQYPSAFVCTNDQEAIELIGVAKDFGLHYPQDLSIVSFDNSTLASLPNLSLTSINHPSLYMGERATDILLDKIAHPEVRTSTVTMIDPELVERNSVTNITAIAAK